MADLLTLPMEVLKMVAKEAMTDDLPSMRLVCRRLNEATIELFGARNFRHRRCTVTPQSLQALEDISNHPVLQRYVKSITFGSYILNPPSRLLEDIDEFKGVQYKHLIQIATDQWCLVDRKTHSGVLAQTLRNLKNCGNTEVFLGIFDDVLTKCADEDPPQEDESDPDSVGGFILVWHEVRRCHGHEFFGTLRLDDSLIASRRAYLIFDMLRDAREMASVPFNSLSLDLSYTDDNRAQTYDGEDGYSAIALGTKLAERLDCYFQIGKDGTCMGSMDMDLTMSHASINPQFSQGHLSLRHHSQTLTLTGIDLRAPPKFNKETWPHLHSHGFGFLRSVVSNACFRTIILQDVLMDQWALDHLILRNAARLERLELCNVHIARDGSLGTDKKGKLVTFTENLLENCPNLERLCIDALTLGGPNHNFATVVHSADGSTALDGTAHVRRGLEQLLETISAMYSRARGQAFIY